MACKILVLHPGMEPRPPAVGAQSPTIGPSGNSQLGILERCKDPEFVSLPITL